MKPNFQPFGKPPPFPEVFECLDGWVWHPRGALRHCHRGAIECEAKTLATFYQGPAIERILALRKLLLEGRSQNTTLVRLFPECRACGHTGKTILQVRGNWRRAAMAVHEDAIEALREGQPRLDLLRNVSVLNPRKADVAPGIPVRDPRWDRRHPPEGESTRLAQVYWASRLAARGEDLEAG